MHCALITTAEAKPKVIIYKALWKRIETLYHNVLYAVQERTIIRWSVNDRSPIDFVRIFFILYSLFIYLVVCQRQITY